MKNLIGVFSVLFLWGLSPSAFSIEKEAVEERLSEAGDGASPSISTGQPSKATSVSKLIIPCQTDEGKVSGSGSGGTCKAILPKCSDLKSGYEKKVKEQLSWKIWGYYQGKDIDLDKSTPDQLVGPEMPNTICSVVGHKLQWSGDASDFEIKNQTLGKKAFCGKRPLAQGHETLLGGDKFEILYKQDHGSQWVSYMMGAYPWLIRKNAYDVFQELNPDLSNINDVIKTSEAVKKDFSTLAGGMKDFYSKMADSAKEVCQSGQEDVFKKCQSGGFKLTDPSSRICTLIKSQVAINEGAFPSLIITEIMNRVQNQYDEIFGKVLGRKNPEFNALINSCENAGRGGLLQQRKKFSCAASCLFGGEDFYTNNAYEINESRGEGASRRRCTVHAQIKLSDGTPVFVDGPVAPKAVETSVNQGFAGFVEYLIRTKICGQSKKSDLSVCDQVQIPDKPSNVK